MLLCRISVDSALFCMWIMQMCRTGVEFGLLESQHPWLPHTSEHSCTTKSKKSDWALVVCCVQQTSGSEGALERHLGSTSICEFYFTELQKQLWQCKKCLKNKNKNGGWTNLLSHLRTCVGSDFETELLIRRKMQPPLLHSVDTSSVSVSRKSRCTSGLTSLLWRLFLSHSLIARTCARFQGRNLYQVKHFVVTS